MKDREGQYQNIFECQSIVNLIKMQKKITGIERNCPLINKIKWGSLFF